MVLTPFFAIIAALAALDIAVALLVLLGPLPGFASPKPASGASPGKPTPPRPRITLARVLAAAALTGFVAIVKAGVAVPLLGLERTGLMSLVLLTAGVAAPVVAAVVVFAQRRGAPLATAPARLAAAPALLGLPLFLYSVVLEPVWTRVEHTAVAIDDRRAPDTPILIGVLADIQASEVGWFERLAAQRVNALRPDVILIPGDLYQAPATPKGQPAPSFDHAADGFRELLASLEAPGGVFFIDGNMEAHYDVDPILRDAGVRPLRDEIERVTLADGRSLAIAGLAWRGPESPPAELIDKIENYKNSVPLVVVGHTPTGALHLPENTRADLFIAGHTHGGQVRVPSFGPIMLVSTVPRHVSGGGLHNLNGRSVYVSRGLGCERGQALPVRLNCPPEIGFIEITGGPGYAGSPAEQRLAEAD